MRILIVDDERLASRRLEVLLARRPQYEIAGAARDGSHADRSDGVEESETNLRSLHADVRDKGREEEVRHGADFPEVE